jgi:hypothetical protein
LALTAPAPLGAGPVEIAFIAEEPGVGLGMGLAGSPDIADPALDTSSLAHAKLRADGHPTPLWSVPTREDLGVFGGEARGVWLRVVTWPAAAGYLLAEDLTLVDLASALPGDIVFGAPSRRLRVHRPEE